MLSVRVFDGDCESDAIDRLRHFTGLDGWACFGRVVRLLAKIARHRPDGVLDGVTPAELSTWGGWMGRTDVWADALLRSGILCRPAVDPHHHRRCTAKAPDRPGEPKRAHPPAELAVHDWDRRMGRIYREYLRDSRPGRQRVLLRPPPRGAATPPQREKTPPPRGTQARNRPPRGAEGETSRGAPRPPE